MKKSSGAFLIASNNMHIDYVKQAVFLAGRIKKYLDLPTTILTDAVDYLNDCLLYTSPSPRDLSTSRMPSSA